MHLWIHRSTALAVLAMAVCGGVFGSTGYIPPRWLDFGGMAAERSPEFYWHLEMRRLSACFKPAEQRVAPLIRPATEFTPEAEESHYEQARRVDVADFENALSTGRLRPAHADDARKAHAEARQRIDAANEVAAEALPAEEPSEFADYHRGAMAFRRGQDHYPEARDAWKRLLERPAEERHYRSVWAAFMLGKLDLYAGKPEAVTWFQKTRQLAKDGFADSLGLAADSYGWEAKAELDQGHPEKAAPLYLTQLALGDESAVVSLKALVADRPSVYGMLDFAPLPPEDADEATLEKFAAEWAIKQQEGLLRAARDPLLRRITSAHVLATETVASIWVYGIGQENDEEPNRGERWLDAVEKAGVQDIESAELLGWVAYHVGDYHAAQRWLELSKEDTATALWLKAKLLRRAGNLEESARAMAAAWRIIRTESSWDFSEGDFHSRHVFAVEGLSPVESASGDLGALNLSRADFIQAFDIFYKGGLRKDAAFVAERVLTADELKTYVDAKVRWGEEEERSAADVSGRWDADPAQPGFSLRWLLGRRLVREDRYQEARPYLPAKYREVLDRYTAALKRGADSKLAKQERARAWFEAALIARRQGMEIMGTEVEPDGFDTDGAFEPTRVANERATGMTHETRFEEGREIEVAKPQKLYVSVTKEEKSRLAKHSPTPNKRFHYRYVAAGLGWKAAQLLPDQSAELADVLNTSGGWIKRDPKQADKFFQSLERRASHTEVGKAAIARRWFVEMKGPWSGAPGAGETE